MKRRQMLKLFARAVGRPWSAAPSLYWCAGAARRFAEDCCWRIPPSQSRLENPKFLALYLPVTPIDKFGTMGLSEQTPSGVDLQRWGIPQLACCCETIPVQLRSNHGDAGAFLTDVSLICPGVFAYHALLAGDFIWPLRNRPVSTGKHRVDVGCSGGTL